MRTTIIGGHGKVARRLAALLSRDRHDVTAWVRNAGHIADVKATGATALTPITAL